jgi:Nuclease-related domain/N-6 DNA Methylase
VYLMGLQRAIALSKGPPLPEAERSVLEVLARELPGGDAVWSAIEVFAPGEERFEIDLIILGHYAVYLVEVKAWPGEVEGGEDGDWTISVAGGKRVQVENPIGLARRKAKLLASRFAEERGAAPAPVVPLVVLSSQVQPSLTPEAQKYVVTLPELCRIVVAGSDGRFEREPPEPMHEATASEVRRILGGVVRGPRPGRGQLRDELPLLLRDIVLDLRAPLEWRRPLDDTGGAAVVAHVLTGVGPEAAAQALIVACCFARALEERGLLPGRLAGPGAEDAQRAFVGPEGSVAGYVAAALRGASEHAAGAPVFEGLNWPWDLLSNEGATSLLDFFRRGTEGRAGWRSPGGPWVELYDAVLGRVTTTPGVVPTPAFVGDLLLDLTLEPACDEAGSGRVDVIDPACGAGRLLVQAFTRLHERLRRASPTEAPEALAREALNRIHGVDIEPCAVMIARAQLVLAYLDKTEASRPLTVHVERANALLPLDADAGENARAVLGRRYEVVVTEPPFEVIKDPALRERYRALYASARVQASLVAPFIERCIELAAPGGFVGVFASNSFMQRRFGKALIEQVLAKIDLTHIIDASGAYIPGHGTPTTILAARNRAPRSDTVRAVMGKRGEPISPLDPAKGEVWSRIVAHVRDEVYEDDYIAVRTAPRDPLKKHPWRLGAGPASAIDDALVGRDRQRLRDVVDMVGSRAMSGLDGVFHLPPDVAGRLGIERDVLRPALSGQSIRAWGATPVVVCIAPYERDSDALRPADRGARWWRFLWRYRATLGSRRFGDRSVELWWAWSRWTSRPGAAPSIALPRVWRHVEAAVVTDDAVLAMTVVGVELKGGRSQDDLFAVLGFLNSSTVCHWMKRISHPKGLVSGGPSGVYALGENFADVPIPDAVLDPGPLRAEIVRIARRLDGLARERAAWTQEQALAKWDRASRDSLLEALSDAQARDRSCLRTMVSLQEDLDWLVYEAIGLVDDTLRGGPGGAPPDERPFAWTSNEPPRRLDKKLVETWKRRRLAMQGRAELSTLESAEYKRSFEMGSPAPLLPVDDEPTLNADAPVAAKPRDRDAQARRAAACEAWLLDRIEEVFRGQGTPRCLGVEELAGVLATTAGVREIVWLYRSGPREADLAPLIERLVSACAVPHLAALRHTKSGMEKRRAWEQAWEAQRREDAGEAVTPTVPPIYDTKDYLDMSTWRLRGKYDVPSEHFVAYPDAGVGGATLFGWAGWNTEQSAAALLALHEQASRPSSGDPARLVPLLAGLLELAAPAPEVDLLDGYRALVEAEAQRMGLTVEEILAFRPPRGQRGR